MVKTIIKPKNQTVVKKLGQQRYTPNHNHYKIQGPRISLEPIADLSENLSHRVLLLWLITSLITGIVLKTIIVIVIGKRN